MATQIWRVGVKVYGKKKRARKIDWHTSANDKGHNLCAFPGETELTTMTLEAAPTCKAWLHDNITALGNHPTGKSEVQMTFTKWTIDGAGSEVWEPFNREHNVTIPIDDAWGLK